MGTAMQEEVADLWLKMAGKVDKALDCLASPDNIKVRELVAGNIGELVIETLGLLIEKVASLHPIETAPTDGTYVLLFGLSGYQGVAFRCEVGRYDHRYKLPWRNHRNDSFTDDGGPPTHWMPMPSLVPYRN